MHSAPKDASALTSSTSRRCQLSSVVWSTRAPATCCPRRSSSTVGPTGTPKSSRVRRSRRPICGAPEGAGTLSRGDGAQAHRTDPPLCSGSTLDSIMLVSAADGGIGSSSCLRRRVQRLDGALDLTSEGRPSRPGCPRVRPGVGAAREDRRQQARSRSSRVRSDGTNPVFAIQIGLSKARSGRATMQSDLTRSKWIKTEKGLPPA